MREMQCDKKAQLTIEKDCNICYFDYSNNKPMSVQMFGRKLRKASSHPKLLRDCHRPSRFFSDGHGPLWHPANRTHDGLMYLKHKAANYNSQLVGLLTELAVTASSFQGLYSVSILSPVPEISIISLTWHKRAQTLAIPCICKLSMRQGSNSKNPQYKHSS